MDLPKGKKISELYFKPELVDTVVDLDLCRENIHVHLAEKDDKVGNITMPETAAQRTRFGVIRGVGPEVDKEKAEIGDVVAIQFHVGAHLNAPAFGFRDKSHVICTAHNIMFRLRDKE